MHGAVSWVVAWVLSDRESHAGACRRGHELRTNWVLNASCEYPLDLGQIGLAERPAKDLVDGGQLPGMPRASRN
ncbi:hypothetical protein CCR91_10260 [Thiorhodovibrio winogradskyi]|nr:hypothetical protein [Thiorhodovibrio winogradskyi]